MLGATTALPAVRALWQDNAPLTEPTIHAGDLSVAAGVPLTTAGAHAWGDPADGTLTCTAWATYGAGTDAVGPLPADRLATLAPASPGAVYDVQCYYLVDAAGDNLVYDLTATLPSPAEGEAVWSPEGAIALTAGLLQHAGAAGGPTLGTPVPAVGACQPVPVGTSGLCPQVHTWDPAGPNAVIAQAHTLAVTAHYRVAYTGPWPTACGTAPATEPAPASPIASASAAPPACPPASLTLPVPTVTATQVKA